MKVKSFEIDTSSFQENGQLKIGTPVKVFHNDYAGTKILLGIIMGFAQGNNIQAIEILCFDDSQTKVLVYCEANDKVEIAKITSKFEFENYIDKAMMYLSQKVVSLQSELNQHQERLAFLERIKGETNATNH